MSAVFSRKSLDAQSKILGTPRFGQVGFRRSHSDPNVVEEVVFDKGGAERRRGAGEVTHVSPPSWVTLDELRIRKEARSRYYHVSQGRRDFLRRQTLRAFLGRDGLEHPHARA